MSDLDDKVTHFKQDMTLYKRHFENKRSDEEVKTGALILRLIHQKVSISLLTTH